MNDFQNIKVTLKTKPSNAFLLFLTGFFLSQFMLINILYAKHPFGGWETSLGSISNSSIFIAFLLLLSACLCALCRALFNKTHRSNYTMKDNIQNGEPA